MTIRNTILGIGILAFFLVGAIFISTGFSQSKEGLPEKTQETGENTVEGRVLTGFVDGFTMDRLYIDGTDYALSKNVECYSSQGQPLAKEKIKRGCRIKYLLNSRQEVEIMQPEPGQDNDDW